MDKKHIKSRAMGGGSELNILRFWRNILSFIASLNVSPGLRGLSVAIGLRKMKLSALTIGHVYSAQLPDRVR